MTVPLHGLGDDPAPAEARPIDARAAAYRRFEIARQELNRALTAWLLTFPSRIEIGDEADATCRAVRQLVAMGEAGE